MIHIPDEDFWETIDLPKVQARTFQRLRLTWAAPVGNWKGLFGNMLRGQRIFIECTSTYLSGGNTGIQRVVRNMVNCCLAAGQQVGVRCEPVIWDELHGQFTRIQEVGVAPSDDIWSRPEEKNLLQLGKEAINRMPLTIRNVLLRPSAKVLLKTMAKAIERHVWSRQQRAKGKMVQIGANDILFLLDATWNISPWSGVNKAKRRGAKIGAIVYDLVPVVKPTAFVEELVRSFRTWLKHILACSDFLICISETVAKEAAIHLRPQSPRIEQGDIRIGFSHLGVGLDHANRYGPVRNEVRAIFQDANAQRPYLCVSTIEPRKNHGYLLDAFDLAWASGSQASLIVVGKKGWKCDGVLKRLAGHPMLGKRLWAFHDLNDDEVAHCYRHARANISASSIEGFGLPIVEALSMGCRVWLSDIPVYREVGGDFCLYFDLASPESLKKMLLADDRPDRIRPPRPLSEFTWPDWRISTEALIRRILELAPPTSSRNTL